MSPISIEEADVILIDCPGDGRGIAHAKVDTSQGVGEGEAGTQLTHQYHHTR